MVSLEGLWYVYLVCHPYHTESYIRISSCLRRSYHISYRHWKIGEEALMELVVCMSIEIYSISNTRNILVIYTCSFFRHFSLDKRECD